MVVTADSRARLGIDQLRGLSFQGSPAALSVVDEGSGAGVRVDAGEDGSFDVPCPSAPRLLTVEWDDGGMGVAAQLDVVSRRYCSVGDVKAYRADQYDIAGRCTDEQVEAAIAKAEEVIEAECRRALQPVMRLGYVDRGACPDRRYRNMLMGEGGYQSGVLGIVRATCGGEEVGLGQVRPGSSWVDVTPIPVGAHAEVAFTCGLRHTPPEAHNAVVELAAFYLAERNAPDNATSTSTELGVLSFVIGGVNGATSLPEVNALIARYRLADYQVG